MEQQHLLGLPQQPRLQRQAGRHQPLALGVAVEGALAALPGELALRERGDEHVREAELPHAVGIGGQHAALR